MKTSVSFRRFFNNLRIKHKLLLAYGLLVLIAAGAVSALSFYKTSGMIEERVVESTRKSFEQANTFIAYKLNRAKEVSSMLFMNRTLQQILSKGGPDYSLGEQIDDYNSLLDLIRSAQNSREIYSIRLFVDSERIFAKENITILDMASIKDSDWYAEMLRNADGIYCRSTYTYNYLDARGAQNIISCVRPMFSDGFSGKIIGVLSIDILESSIRDIISKTNITKNGHVYLVDESGRILSGLDKARIGERLDSVWAVPGFLAREAGTQTIREGGRSSILIHQKVEGTNWRLVAIIPQREILEPVSRLAKDTLLVLVAVIALAAVTAVWISEGITRRISLLLQHIRKLEDEKWDVRLAVDSTDEVGVLQSHINRMSETMQRLITEKYEVEVQKKSAELKALQAQINPHFLYNTLDLIHWLALKHRAAEISEVVGRLAKFFRLSLSKGRDIVSIRDELEHVRTYTDIQNKRFGGAIVHLYDVEPGLEEFATVKLILQPLVENAIVHGIMEKEHKTGTIRITVKREAELIAITVEDDGVGMSADQVRRLMERSPESGYGVHNVVEKIKLYFGDAYGLTYESDLGKGTKVTIRFPAVLYRESSGRSGGSKEEAS